MCNCRKFADYKRSKSESDARMLDELLKHSLSLFNLQKSGLLTESDARLLDEIIEHTSSLVNLQDRVADVIWRQNAKQYSTALFL